MSGGAVRGAAHLLLALKNCSPTAGGCRRPWVPGYCRFYSCGTSEEPKMKMKLTLLAAAALSLLSTTASAVDWGGYMRIGPGQKVEAGHGDRSDCFSGTADTGGKGGVGRLGNECNTYGEFLL